MGSLRYIFGKKNELASRDDNRCKICGYRVLAKNGVKNAYRIKNNIIIVLIIFLVII